MVKFHEIPGKAIEAVGRYSQEQLEARRLRLESPVLKRRLEQTVNLVGEDIRNVGRSAASAAWKMTLGAPISSIIEGTKTLGSVIGHNWSTKKKKRGYTEVPTAMVEELLSKYASGAWDIVKVAGHLSKALTRTTVLGARYLIGK